MHSVSSSSGPPGPLSASAEMTPLEFRSARRASRVLLLLACILILSITDLLLTLTHLQSVGMAEANPIVVKLVETTRSPLILVLFKLATVAVCTMLLYRVRHYRSGEIGAWIATLVLVGVSLLWSGYSDAVEEIAAQGPADGETMENMITLGK